VESTNKPSNNFFAEMLLKELGGAGAGKGTTDKGARRTRRFAKRLGARARIVDGSGLAHQNRASPRNVVDLLVGLDRRTSFAAEFEAFKSSLPIAGVDGTLSDRMRGGPAEGRCQAKTGTLTGVSALSGYCRSKGGDRLAFSFLMNGIDVGRARNLQDRMTNALARYGG
jgi:D-alanyl-D-alanine carboxypeptidase/D-alanyl-D-alanine-endopeptidase (penicillin-binding protein 4)